ncbi:hypothetical protein KUCAC02_021030, partial [Chaenocephalus aceratus]
TKSAICVVKRGRYFSEKETCEPCDSSCRHCTGLRPDQCLTCHRGFALHAVERRCTRCCQAGVNDTDCCVCDGRSGLCVEAPQPKSGDDQVTDLNVSSAALKHTSAGVPIALLLLALGLALAVFALVKAHAKKKLCWGQSYERLNGSANMPHGIPEPDSGDEDADAPHHVDESTCLNQM